MPEREFTNSPTFLILACAMSSVKNGSEGLQVTQLETLDPDSKVLQLDHADRVVLEKKLLRKIDLRLMPLMMLICKLGVD